jgi:MraZ protein
VFYGEFDYKLDEKGRLPIPPKYRGALKDGVVLTPGAENCITVYTVSEWRKLSSTITNNPLARSKMRMLRRALFSTAFSTKIDAQGRIAIPPTLREHARITEDAIVAGNNLYLEIWDKALWEEMKALARDQMGQIIESLENNG